MKPLVLVAALLAACDPAPPSATDAGAPTGCAVVDCAARGHLDCGTIDDGCGGTLDCGFCGGLQSCAGAGVANVCGCAPASCATTQTECGVIPDACGGLLDCGGCAPGLACGAGGLPYRCGRTTVTPNDDCTDDGWCAARRTPDVRDFWVNSDDDVWAIAEGLLRHWDGAAWSSFEVSAGPLNAIWASGPDDVWVAGNGFVLRWNGTRWDEVLRGQEAFTAITGHTASSVFVLGRRLHEWDGVAWRVHELPIRTGPEGDAFLEWDAPSAADFRRVTAVAGELLLLFGNGAHRLSRGQWLRVVPPEGIDRIDGIAGSGPDDLWIFDRQESSSSGVNLARFDGTRWNLATAPWGLDTLVVISADAAFSCHRGNLHRFDHGTWSPLGADCRGVLRASRDGQLWRVVDDVIERWDGTAWQRRYEPDRISVRDVFPSAGPRQWLDPGGVPMYRTDAGWIALPRLEYPGSLRIFSPTSALIGGSEYLARYDGTDRVPFPSSQIPVGLGVSLIARSPADFMVLWCGNCDESLGAARAGRFQNGRFTRLSPLGGREHRIFVAVSGTDPDDFWAATDRELVHYAGGDWIAYRDRAGVRALWRRTDDDVWAVGQEGLILHFDGADWRSVPSGTREPLSGIWGRAPDDIFAVGIGGGILHWDGSRWLPMRSPVRVRLAEIDGGDGLVWMRTHDYNNFFYPYGGTIVTRR